MGRDGAASDETPEVIRVKMDLRRARRVSKSGGDCRLSGSRRPGQDENFTFAVNHEAFLDLGAAF